MALRRLSQPKEVNNEPRISKKESFSRQVFSIFDNHNKWANSARHEPEQTFHNLEAFN